ncbi:zonadhesin-like, partial [Phlebotomus argentipes]|uniref:zonadhesin-like n=1 Tax=Phlebotomus argentipes TaxID=94469 RepID=UPI0028933D87
MDNRCYCEVGFKRIAGICLPDVMCPCAENEKYTFGDRCHESCRQSYHDCPKDESYRDCFCKEGFVRVNGMCQPFDKCPCNDNEVFTYGNSCEEECKYGDQDCAEESSSKGCFCDDGYVRINGLCVLGSNCGCGENEEYANSNECSEDCSKTWNDCREEPSAFRCVCLRHYKRIDGKCVKDVNCPCPENEVFSHSTECDETCGTTPDECGLITIINKCFCKPGYKRISGVCVEDSLCPCADNEEYTFGDRCQESCRENYDDCPQGETYRGCFCKEGFVRVNGICQTFDKCPCQGNEIFRYSSKCNEVCNDGTHDCTLETCTKGCFCEDAHVRIMEFVCHSNCPCPENEEYIYSTDCLENCDIIWSECLNVASTFKCHCKRNHYRVNGKCVPQRECPCPNNEVYGFMNDCYETCGTTIQECAIINNNNKCYCDFGYKRIAGTCVTEDMCPCAENEKYTFGDRCHESCRQSYHDCPKDESYRDCFCKEGFVRVNGMCQPFDKCPCNDNEVFTYGNSCEEESIVDVAKTRNMPIATNAPKTADVNCPCPENEVFSHSTECDETCGTTPDECGLITIINKCFCKPGYKRISGVCVEDSLCPCADNEEYTFGDRCQESCRENYDDCPQGETYRGCFCKEGFVRVNGICQTFDKCPCQGNEIFRYSSKCNEVCMTVLMTALSRPVQRDVSAKMH